MLKAFIYGYLYNGIIRYLFVVPILLMIYESLNPVFVSKSKFFSIFIISAGSTTTAETVETYDVKNVSPMSVLTKIN